MSLYPPTNLDSHGPSPTRRWVSSEEAQAAVAEVMRTEPNYTIGGISRPTKTFENADDDQHFFDGLRKAGLPK
jgi:hypothetical protein